MLPRILEPEVMDSPEEASDYDAMDHAAVNRAFVADFLVVWDGKIPVLDVGTGTAQIPIALCKAAAGAEVLGIDMAENMLRIGRDNVRNANLTQRIRLERADAKRLHYTDKTFGAVISNSIIHHIPKPALVLAEMLRVTQRAGFIIVRDLLRPATEAELEELVNIYAAGANEHQRKMFADSLRAALTLHEIRALVMEFGGEAGMVKQTSDRHWTWKMRKP
jgi:ubiquinone/menaquinone biosynthesis C-methylase UbiE